MISLSLGIMIPSHAFLKAFEEITVYTHCFHLFWTVPNFSRNYLYLIHYTLLSKLSTDVYDQEASLIKTLQELGIY